MPSCSTQGNAQSKKEELFLNPIESKNKEEKGKKVTVLGQQIVVVNSSLLLVFFKCLVHII